MGNVEELSRFKLWLRLSSVGIFSTLADIISMYLLATYSDISIRDQLYISSGISLSIGFIGQKLWTFKNNLRGNALVKQIAGFLVWEITFIYLVAHAVIYLTEPINEQIRHISPETFKSSWILRHVLHIDTDKDGKEHVELNTLTNIAIKHIIIFILFNVSSVPIYKRLFKY